MSEHPREFKTSSSESLYEQRINIFRSWDISQCESNVASRSSNHVPQTSLCAGYLSDLLISGLSSQGVMSGLLTLPSFVKTFPEINVVSHPKDNHVTTIQGITVASYNLGCFLGAVITIFIGDLLGRRKMIFLGSSIMVIGAILQCTAFSLPHLIVGVRESPYAFKLISRLTITAATCHRFWEWFQYFNSADVGFGNLKGWTPRLDPVSQDQKS